MSIKGVLWRFLAAYIVLVIGLVIVLKVLGIPTNSGLNVGILIGAVLWPCMAFGMKNKRYFTPDEKTKVVWGMIVINLLLQLVVGAGALAAEGKLRASAILIALAIVGLLHSIAIYYFVGLGGKLVVKQLAREPGFEPTRPGPMKS
jgi:hypothetical protein